MLLATSYRAFEIKYTCLALEPASIIPLASCNSLCPNILNTSSSASTMRVLMLLALSSLSAASLHAKHLAARGHDNSYPSSGSPFTLEPAFTITLQLAAFPPAIQPPNFNGTVGLVPVTSGTVSGPLLNGTITQGLGVGHRSSTGFLDDDINYGHTDDGVEFLFRQTGGGQSSGSVERLVSVDLFFLLAPDLSAAAVIRTFLF